MYCGYCQFLACLQDVQQVVRRGYLKFGTHNLFDGLEYFPIWEQGCLIQVAFVNAFFFFFRKTLVFAVGFF